MTGTTYSGTVKFYNELETPREDITEEIEAEDDEHEVFYSVDTGSATITKNDVDGDGNPLGLEITMTTITAGTDIPLTIILRHEPTKPNNGLSDAGGETDIQAVIGMDIQ